MWLCFPIEAWLELFPSQVVIHLTDGVDAGMAQLEAASVALQREGILLECQDTYFSFCFILLMASNQRGALSFLMTLWMVRSVWSWIPHTLAVFNPLPLWIMLWRHYTDRDSVYGISRAEASPCWQTQIWIWMSQNLGHRGGVQSRIHTALSQLTLTDHLWPVTAEDSWDADLFHPKWWQRRTGNGILQVQSRSSTGIGSASPALCCW